jgi:hypothetical protein
VGLCILCGEGWLRYLRTSPPDKKIPQFFPTGANFCRILRLRTNSAQSAEIACNREPRNKGDGVVRVSRSRRKP